MSIFNIKDVIGLFSNNKFRLISLILILVSISLITWIKVYYSSDDCKPLLDQNKLLIEQNSSLMDQNSQIINRNKNLIDSYLKIQDLLGSITTDTIFITRTERTMSGSYTKDISGNFDGSDEESTKESYFLVSSPIEKSEIKVTSTKINSSNKKKIISEIQAIIENSKVK
jgi:hypothetical protein